MSSTAERRQSPRIPVLPTITCRLKVTDRYFEGTIRDMSVTGLFVEVEEQLQVSDECEVEIILQGERSSIKIEGLHGRVIRCETEGVGVQFDGRMEWFAMVSACFFRRV